MRTIAIIGGGAAGLAAAVAAGNALEYAQRRGKVADVEIVVFEADERVGRSILRSGNGRCNYTNSRITSFGLNGGRSESRGRNASNSLFEQTEPEYYHPEFVNEVLRNVERWDAPYRGKRGAAETREGNAAFFLFEDLGMFYREEDDGRCYPLSGKASTVLNLLRDACKRLGVRIECEVRIDEIEPPRENGADRFLIRVHDRRVFHADQVIVATGGRTAKTMLRGVAGLNYAKTRPVLAPLAVRESQETRRMDNVRVRCSVELLRGGARVALEVGEILFRKYGVSGIAVFNLSRYAQPGDTLRIHFSSWTREGDLTDLMMRARKNSNLRQAGTTTCEGLLRGILQEPVADVVLDRAGIKGKAVADKDAVEKLAHILCNFDLTVEGVGDERVAQVQRGGFAVGGETGVSALDMSVAGIPSLRIVGEALDVDGPCGGYNLHFAWSSGMLAGYAAADSLITVL